VLFAEGEDVVAYDIFASVMLVEAGALGAIDDIVLPNDIRAAFIRIQTPAAVGEGVDVVDQIVADDGAALDAQCIDSAHVAEHKLADVVHVIELDDIFAAGRLLVAPVPADRNRRVIEIVDMVVRDAIAAALQNKDADGRWVNHAEMVHFVVGYDLAVVLLEWLLAFGGFADANSTATDVEHLVADNLSSLAAAAKFQGIAGQVRERAVRHHAIHCAFRPNVAVRGYRCLSVRITVLAQCPIGVTECESTKGNVVD